nr:hypothetical protein [Bacteroidota bacterium]
MNNLKPNEVYQLNRIKEAILNNTPFDDVLKLCEEINPTIDDPEFAYTYAACLLATKDRIEDAMRMFFKNREDLFCSIMYDYLKEIGAFEMVSKVFKSAKPYHIYTQTPLYQTHEKGVVENICNFAKNNPPPESESLVTILDIGPGDGELTAQYVNKIASLHNLKSIRLVFVDPFEEELKAAEENCKEKISIPCEVIGICSKIQEITPEQIARIRQVAPIWFVNAALSVHHMPREVKIPMLKQMKAFSSKFILSEVNWNHDLPEKDSPELIYSVAKNYGIFCRDILNLPVSEEDRKLCLYHFPIDEAINIIKQERPNRIDYHTTIEEWKKIAHEAGYLVHDPVATYLYEDKPFLFVMGFYGNE